MPDKIPQISALPSTQHPDIMVTGVNEPKNFVICCAIAQLYRWRRRFVIRGTSRGLETKS